MPVVSMIFGKMCQTKTVRKKLFGLRDFQYLYRMVVKTTWSWILCQIRMCF